MENQSETQTDTNNTSNKTKLLVPAATGALVLIAGAVFVFSQNNSTDPQTTSTQRPATTQITEVTTIPEETLAENSQAKVVEVKVGATEFSFTPDEIRVNQGDTVRIVFSNTGTMMHDWTLDEFNAATKTIGPGETDTIEFVANKTGEFEFYCSVGNHRAQGMVGTLIVE